MRRKLRADGTPETAPMYPHEIAARLSSIGKLDYSALPVPDATTDDFDKNEIARLKTLVQEGRNADSGLVDLDEEELLGALGLVVEDGGTLRPTIAGLLLAGRKKSLSKYLPTHSASFQVLEGTEVRVNRSYRQGLLFAIEDMATQLESWNPQHEYERGL